MARPQHYQTIDVVNLVRLDERPYARAAAPRWWTPTWRWAPDLALRYGFDSEVVNFHRDDRGSRHNGWRVDLMPRVALDLTRPGLFRAPGARLARDPVRARQPRPRPARALALAHAADRKLRHRAGVRARTGSRDQRKLTLEPRLLYLYVPYRNQDELPVFDTALPDLNPVELFRTNRYVGADRVSDANQVSVGVTSRLLDAGDGRQFLAATLGQTYYFQTPRVHAAG